METCCDHVKLTYGDTTTCTSHSRLPNVNWTDTYSELLLITFYSDYSDSQDGFRIETECHSKSEANPTPKSKLLQCYETASRLFLQPAPETNNTKNDDFTSCVFKDFFNITDLCDDDACQMPPGTPQKHLTSETKFCRRFLSRKPVVHSSNELISYLGRCTRYSVLMALDCPSC